MTQITVLLYVLQVTLVLYILQIALLFYMFADNATFLEIFLNVTACDTEQYQCYVLSTGTDEGQAQASLEVSNRNYSLPFTYKILDSFAVTNFGRVSLLPADFCFISCSFGENLSNSRLMYLENSDSATV